MSKKVLHVINISFVTSYFFGNQFKYLKAKTGNTYYVACSPSVEHLQLASKYDYVPFEVSITRSINPLIDIKSVFKLIKFIKQNNIDVVVGHTPKGGMIAMLAAFFTGVEQRVYFRHGIVYETSKGFKKFLLKSIERISGGLAQKVVCVSKSVMLVSKEDGLNNYDKNLMLGLGTCNGVDTKYKFNPSLILPQDLEDIKNKLGLDKASFVLGYVGRLVNDKGIPELIDAWKKVIVSNPEAKLLLVGPLESRDGVSLEIQRYIETESSIIHTGFVPNAALYMKCMDVLILPTYREGFPTVILEASSLEIPILITKATGCEEAILPNKTGRFITHSTFDIEENIQFYIQNPEVRKQHGLNGREFVTSSFDQEIVWNFIHQKLNY